MSKKGVSRVNHAPNSQSIKIPKPRPAPKTDHLKATQWKPGQSGNPAGRPKGVTLSEAYRRMLAQPFPADAKRTLGEMISKGASVAEVLAMMMVRHTVRGSVSAAVELRRATEGDNVTISSGWRESAEKAGIDHSVIVDVLANAISKKL